MNPDDTEGPGRAEGETPSGGAGEHPREHRRERPGKGSGDRPGSTPRTAPEASRLRTAGQLVEGGGMAGGLTTLLYVVIGMGFWSLVGWGADRVLGTRWIVVLGACIGAVSGIYVVYLHMQAGLRRHPTSDGAGPHKSHRSGPDSAPRP